MNLEEKEKKEKMNQFKWQEEETQEQWAKRPRDDEENGNKKFNELRDLHIEMGNIQKETK